MRKLVIFLLIISAASSLFAIKRSKVIANADAYAMYTWTLSSANISGPSGCMSGVSNRYGSSGTAYSGLPYDWGGYMSISTFMSGIQNGRRAGSCPTSGACSVNGILSCTVGVDCSGYVSRTFETGYYQTSRMHEITSTLSSPSLLKKGDIFNKAGSHVIMYIYTDQSTGDYYVMESTTGSYDKVVFRKYPNKSTLLNSYKLRRLNTIEDDVNPEGTMDNPAVIESLPFSHDGNTRNVVSLEINSYSSAENINERGPEFIYTLEVPEDGTLSVKINGDNSYIDNDIHLLSSLDLNASKMAEDTVARDDSEIVKELTSGTYYIVVDSYSGSSRDYPGRYTLSVNFSPLEGVDSGEPADEDSAVDEEPLADSDAPPVGDGELKGFAYNLTSGLENVEGNRIGGARCVLATAEYSYKVEANPKGLFLFGDIVPGDYTLSISAAGFFPTERDITILESETTWGSTGLEEDENYVEEEPGVEDLPEEDPQFDDGNLPEEGYDADVAVNDDDLSQDRDAELQSDDDGKDDSEKSDSADFEKISDRDNFIADSDQILEDNSEDSGCSCSVIF